MDARVAPRPPGDPWRLGPYELLGRLGQGDLGVVFLGRERRGGRLAAVKALRPELADDPAFAARVRREVDAARRVDSPYVARVLGADPTGPRPWLATEHIDGRTLADTVAATGPLTGERLLGFAAGVAHALTAIYGAGVVHRDLKPTNVLLKHGPGSAGLEAAGPASPRVKVIDFGIARAADATMTRSGIRVGTPLWMAPEQLEDRPAGPATDVFAGGSWSRSPPPAATPSGAARPRRSPTGSSTTRPTWTGCPGPCATRSRPALARDPAARPTAARLATTLDPAPPTLPLPAADPTPLLPVAVAGGAGAAEVAARAARDHDQDEEMAEDREEDEEEAVEAEGRDDGAPPAPATRRPPAGTPAPGPRSGEVPGS